MKRIKMGNGAATNSLLLTMVSVVTTLLGMVVTKFLSVNFSLGEYGTYSQALLVTSTATSFSILGLTNATNYFYNRTSDEEAQKKYVSTIFTIQYLIGVLCAVVIIVFRRTIASYFGNDDLNLVLFIVAFTPLFTNLMSMYQTLFVSIGKAKLLAVRNLVVALLRLATVVIACFVAKNIIVVLTYILVMDIVQVVYFAVVFKKEKYFLLPMHADFSLVSEILKFSVPMSIFIMTNSLTRDIDKYVVSAFSDTETLAIYTNASKVLPFDLVTASMITVLIPVITRLINTEEYQEAQKVFRLYLRMGCVLTFILVGGAIAVADDLMLFFYDAKYLAGKSVFVVYLFVDMIRFANVTTILSGSGKSKVLMRISISILAANAVLNVLAYNMLGVIGPALTTLGLTAVMILLMLHFGAKEIRCKVIDLFNIKEVLLICMEIAVVGVGAHFLSGALTSWGVPLVLRLICAYGGYAIVMVVANFRRVLECYRALNAVK